MPKATYGNVIIDGAKMTEARLAAGLSMQDVAGFLGINRSSISRWERGTLNVSPEHVQKLLLLFRCEDFTVSEAKLNQEKVRKIRKLCAEKTRSHREIGEQFGIPKQIVGMISRNRTWKE